MPLADQNRSRGGARKAAPASRFSFLKSPRIVVGLLLLAMGGSLLAYSGWSYTGSNLVATYKQQDRTEALKQQWTASTSVPSKPTPQKTPKPTSKVVAKPQPAPQPLLGQEPEDVETFALVRIPRFGEAYEMPVNEGVGQASLAMGIGWDQNSARPGTKGNLVLAAHRVTHGEPFSQFPSLEKGDTVEVENRTHIFTYALTNSGTDWTVNAGEGWVTNPVPGKAVNTKPKEKIITLITCTDLYASERRSIVAGKLVKTVKK